MHELLSFKVNVSECLLRMVAPHNKWILRERDDDFESDKNRKNLYIRDPTVRKLSATSKTSRNSSLERADSQRIGARFDRGKKENRETSKISPSAES